MKNSEYESCREIKNLQLLFQEKVQPNNGLKVILNFQKLHNQHLSFQVIFVTFTPKIQLDIDSSFHGEHVYSFS